VVTTELSTTKIAAAKKTFAETALDDVITILEGDALNTLEGLDGPADFVLLDGWKDLYLPVIKLLEPRLPTGALVIADNASAADMKPYLDYVRNPGNATSASTSSPEKATAWRSAAAPTIESYFSDSSSHGVSHFTPSGVRWTPSLRTLMPSTLAV